jgi:hypothetical protein
VEIVMQLRKKQFGAKTNDGISQRKPDSNRVRPSSPWIYGLVDRMDGKKGSEVLRNLTRFFLSGAPQNLLKAPDDRYYLRHVRDPALHQP